MKPLWEPFVTLFPKLEPFLANLNKNCDYYQRETSRLEKERLSSCPPQDGDEAEEAKEGEEEEDEEEVDDGDEDDGDEDDGEEDEEEGQEEDGQKKKTPPLSTAQSKRQRRVGGRPGNCRS